MEEGLEEAQELVDHFQNVGVGVISTFSILVILAIIWSFENWGSIRKLFSKGKSPLLTPPDLENIRRTIGDFLKIRGMNLPEERNLSNPPMNYTAVTPYSAGYAYHSPTVQPQMMGSGQLSNQNPPPTYNGVGVSLPGNF